MTLRLGHVDPEAMMKPCQACDGKGRVKAEPGEVTDAIKNIVRQRLGMQGRAVSDYKIRIEDGEIIAVPREMEIDFS